MENQLYFDNRKFNMFCQNLNTGAFTMSENKYNKCISHLGDKKDIQSVVLKKHLEEQYNDYCSSKDLPKSSKERERRIDKLGFIGDRFNLLIGNGLSISELPYTYKLDLSEHIDLAIAMNKHSDVYSICERNTYELCESKNITKWCLSKHLLSQNVTDNLVGDRITVNDLLSISPVLKEHFECIIKKACIAELNVIDCLDLRMSQEEKLSVGADREITTAIALTILNCLEDTILRLLYTIKSDFFENGINCFVDSKFVPGFVISASNPLIRDYYLPVKNGYIKAPLQRVERWN